MGDRGSFRGRGRGRGRGHSQGQGNTDDVAKLAQNIQHLLEDLGVEMSGAASTKSPSKNKQGNRGSVSLMNLNSSQSGQGKQYQRGSVRGRGGRGSVHGRGGRGSVRGRGSWGSGHKEPSQSGSQYDPNQGAVSSYDDDRDFQGREFRSSTLHGHQADYRQDDRSHEYYSPPPSYDESNRQRHHATGSYPAAHLMPPRFESFPHPYNPAEKPLQRNMEEKQPFVRGKSKLAPEEVVKALTVFEGQWCTADALSRHVDSSVEEVDKVVRSRKDIFSCMVDGNDIIVELAPKVNLCLNHLSESGCLSRDSCKNLHICKSSITRFCNLGSSCPYGHRLDTNHNSSVLSKFYLDLISKQVLYNVIKKVFKGNASPQICNSYNSNRGCKRDNCYRLHVCKEYVKGVGKCSFTYCSLNHDIFTDHCKRHLKRCGISLNESPRDILLTLLSSLQDGDQSTPAASSEESSKGKQKKAVKGDSFRENPLSDSESDSDSSEQSDGAGKKKKKKSRGKGNDEERQKSEKKEIVTRRATDICGDVVIPEICIFSLNDKCDNEKKGCRYLHAKSLFHWQVEKGNKWYNFRVHHSKVLEKAYRNISKENEQLLPLDPVKLDAREKDMLKVLGKGSWTAHFRDMHIKDSSGTKMLNIRRVSTRSSAVFNNPKATVYEWYFHDEQGKWICFGEVDSLGKQELVSLITCEEIEKQYLSDPSSSMIISNTRFKYKLDFKQMTQTNLHTQKVREIRRRPARLMYQNKSVVGSDITPKPAHWRPMASNQTHALLIVNPGEADYQDVTSRVRLTYPTANILKIQRLQNPYLWQLFQLKKMSMSSRYDENKMNIQKLFHGIDPKNMDTICKENIDWRRCNPNAIQAFGKGTYFSNSVAVAHRDCVPDIFGYLTMILGDVIVGSMTKGNSNFTRPPLNRATNELFDTTVNDTHAPTIFVKYDKTEYYPEYFIEFS